MIILFSSRSKPLFCGTKNIYVKVQVWFGQDVEYSYYNNFYGAFLSLYGHYKLQYAMRANCLIFAGKH